MLPCNFDESNCVLSAPEGMTAEQVPPLSVCRATMAGNVPVVISCWKPTHDELDEIRRTGRVWLMCVGISQPPVVVMGSSPFE